MATDVILLRGEEVPGRRRRLTRGERRGAGRETVAFLSASAAAELETITGQEALTSGLPVLMGWQPFGRSEELRGARLVDLRADLARLAGRPGLSPAALEAVAELEALVQRAIDEQLTLAVQPD